ALRLRLEAALVAVEAQPHGAPAPVADAAKLVDARRAPVARAEEGGLVAELVVPPVEALAEYSVAAPVDLPKAGHARHVGPRHAHDHAHRVGRVEHRGNPRRPLPVRAAP